MFIPTKEFYYCSNGAEEADITGVEHHGLR